MRAHAGPDDRELSDLVVVHETLEADLVLIARERAQRAARIGLGQRERDVGATGGGRRHVLHDHVDVRAGLRDDLEDLCRLAGHVGDADDRDLGLTEVGRDPGDDGLFHVFSLWSVGDTHPLTEHVGSDARAERRASVNEDSVPARILDGPDVQHLGAVGRQFQHLFGGDGGELARARHDAGVGGEDAVDIAVDLAHVGVEGRRERDGGGVGAASPERGDVTRFAIEPLESGDDDDRALIERLAQANRGHIDDAGGAVMLGRDQAGLTAGERSRLETHRVDGHRHERHRDALAARQQHVELAGRRDRRDLGREIEQFIGGVTHRADGDDDVVPGAARVDDALRDALDALGIRDRRSAVLLDDQRHVELPGEMNERMPPSEPSYGARDSRQCM